MEKISQNYILDISFKTAVDREELLIRKYEEYDNDTDNKEVMDLIRQFRKNAQEHIKLTKEKMIKVNLN